MDNSPSRLNITDIGVPIHIVQSRENSLNNRYLPYSIIETDAVAMLDDDSRGLKAKHISHSFRLKHSIEILT